jgi:hypothetical protein
MIGKLNGKNPRARKPLTERGGQLCQRKVADMFDTGNQVEHTRKLGQGGGCELQDNNWGKKGANAACREKVFLFKAMRVYDQKCRKVVKYPPAARRLNCAPS